MTMRVIAKAGSYRLEQDMNGTITLYNGAGQYVGSSAIDLIREVPDLGIRAELVKQWELDQVNRRYAERQTREVQ